MSKFKIGRIAFVQSKLVLAMVVPPFAITKKQLQNANDLFSPIVLASNPTIVWITSEYNLDIQLVATFSPLRPVDNGIRRVSGKQTLNTNVEINFDKQLSLHWMASVLRKGDISPNQSYYKYSSDRDTFSMSMNSFITLKHDDHGWKIPVYNSSEYTVNIGFGLGLGEYICWGYSVPAQPQMIFDVKAGSYELVRSNRQEKIGDPVAPSKGNWSMPRGYTYTLEFNSCGDGTLTNE
ncbi:hypothetical protein N836_10345 [Leptolyngbya sp. Heron Island J]|uniref:hypothetical protein n=1 Tax=Leptolyngbya sp. Heron Island J TaxID=1385935 RepID=UPI0003B9AA99|nr:hypothetical protein [Leptolyngbya sp. Heron Island J]ESA35920.1 hypothetical protein N836_10345 [Leptolyngbya sp. Heron Island J]